MNAFQDFLKTIFNAIDNRSTVENLFLLVIFALTLMIFITSWRLTSKNMKFISVLYHVQALPVIAVVVVFTAIIAWNYGILVIMVVAILSANLQIDGMIWHGLSASDQISFFQKEENKKLILRQALTTVFAIITCMVLIALLIAKDDQTKPVMPISPPGSVL